MNSLGKLLMLAGLVMACVGLLIIVFDRFGIHPGRLPGDLVYRKGNTTFYFPIVTSILISLLLSLLFWLLKK